VSERLSVGVLPIGALLLTLFAQLPAIDKAVAATTPAPLLQPICDGPVMTLASDAPLVIRLSKPLNLEDYPAPTGLRIPDAMAKQVVAGRRTADLAIAVRLLEVILPADPAVEIRSNIAGSQPQLFYLNRAATVGLERPVSGRHFLPAGMVVKATGGAAATVAEGARGRLALPAGDLGPAMVTAVSGHPLIDPDDVRELAFQLVPSENGPRLRATAEAPGVAFDEAANQLSACLVSEPGGRELRIQIVDVEVDELGVALVSLAVPRALSVRDFDQFVRGDTTYRGRAYLVGADGSYAATGPVQLHGIKLSVFIGIAATFLLLSAIAWMRRHSRDAPVAGIGPFFKGVIVGKSGDASLSLFQIAPVDTDHILRAGLCLVADWQPDHADHRDARAARVRHRGLGRGALDFFDPYAG
jgi:hypothetical protein